MDQPTEFQQTVCTICHEPLKRNISALHCRHVFHHHCISMWLGSAARSRCPNCNQATTLEGIVGPLYLEYEALRPETVVIDSPPSSPQQTPSQYAYEVRIRDLEHLNESLKTRLRKLKLIKVVRETRAELQSPSSIARISNWQHYGRNDLLTIAGALHAKCAAAEREKDTLNERLKSSEEKIAALEEVVRNMTTEERQRMSNWSRAGPSGYKMPWESMSRRVAVAQNNEDDDEDTTDGEGDASSSRRHKRKRDDGGSVATTVHKPHGGNNDVPTETDDGNGESRQEDRYHTDATIPEMISSDEEETLRPAVRIQARQNRPQDPLRLRQIQPTIINLDDSPIIIDD